MVEKEQHIKKPDYLEHRLEQKQVTQEEIHHAREVLLGLIKSRPFVYQESGREIFQGGELDMVLKYGKVNSDLTANFAKHLKEETGNTIESCRLVTALDLKNPDNGQELSIGELLPPGYRIISYHSQEQLPTGFFDPENKICFISGDLSTVFGVGALLHEIGHAADYEGSIEVDNQADDAALVEVEMADLEGAYASREALTRVLRLERNAWAFFLEHFRKVVPLVDQREALYHFVHNYGLVEISDMIEEQLSREALDDSRKLIARILEKDVLERERVIKRI